MHSLTYLMRGGEWAGAVGRGALATVFPVFWPLMEIEVMNQDWGEVPSLVGCLFFLRFTLFSSSRATFPCSPPAQFCHQLFLLFVTPWTAAHHASLSFTISKSLFQFMPTESVLLFNHLILCRPLLLLPSVFASIRGNYWPQILSLSSTSHSVSPLSSSFLLGKVTGFFTCSFISHILLCD